jgi:hypothetical protein
MQPDLFASEPRRAKQKRSVPLSSRLTYQAEHARIGKRADEAKEWLMTFWAAYGCAPTSAELTRYRYWLATGEITTDRILDTRRGLSDLKAAGIAEHAGTRSCQVSGKQATTWRLRTR